MITREELRQLAAVESPESCAVSFYFQPTTPQDKSHRGEVILIKDLVRDALRQVEKHGRSFACRDHLKRLMEVAEHLHGNHARAKAIFACGPQHIWKEYDLPPRLARSMVTINSRFHLKPLTAVFEAGPRCCIALVDRERARLFDYWLDEIGEREQFFDRLDPHGRSDGYAGYKAGHKERRVAEDAKLHFKRFAGRLRELSGWNEFERLMIGCRDETWSEVEPHLHTDVRNRLMGRFTIDPAVAGVEQIRAHADRMLHEHTESARQALIREVIGEAQRDGRGAVGLRNVLLALERGEVQSLLIGQQFSAHGVRCSHCGHMDTRTTRNCAVCGAVTDAVDDISDALIGEAVRRGVGIVYVPPQGAFDRVGNIGALLRFRGDQNTPAKVAM